MFWGEQLGYPAAGITSGKRSAARQRALIAAWDRGDRAGLAVRPAANSAHVEGRAFDLAKVRHLDIYGQLAQYLPGVRWGGTFSTYDPIHFDLGRD